MKAVPQLSWGHSFGWTCSLRFIMNIEHVFFSSLCWSSNISWLCRWVLQKSKTWGKLKGDPSNQVFSTHIFVVFPNSIIAHHTLATSGILFYYIFLVFPRSFPHPAVTLKVFFFSNSFRSSLASKEAVSTSINSAQGANLAANGSTVKVVEKKTSRFRLIQIIFLFLFQKSSAKTETYGNPGGKNNNTNTILNNQFFWSFLWNTRTVMAHTKR